MARAYDDIIDAWLAARGLPGSVPRGCNTILGAINRSQVWIKKD